MFTLVASEVIVMKVLVFVFLTVTATLARHEVYQGWKSYYVGPATAEKLQYLNAVIDEFEADTLVHPIVQRRGIILVKPEHQTAFTNKLHDLDIIYEVHRDNVKEGLDYDDEMIYKRRMETLSRGGAKSLPYDNYQELDAIYDYLDEMASKYPETVTLVEPARSFEGRIIKYLKISTTNFEDESKPVIFIDGGIHAREWISPPTVTWAIHKLVENVTDSDLLDNFDWILLPVVNPDGYVHTFTSNGRWWRKTRSIDQHAQSSNCPGVDGNRNYDFYWNTVGASINPCSDTYAGSRAFSEVETQVVREILHENLHRMPLYLTMHSYGSMILYPWGHDGTLSINALALHTVGIAMANEIEALKLPNFPNYVVGNSALVLGYGIAGSSEDYAHSIGVPLSYTYELPGLARGTEGFNLPPEYIEQVCKETWAGIVVGVRRAGELVR